MKVKSSLFALSLLGLLYCSTGNAANIKYNNTDQVRVFDINTQSWHTMSDACNSHPNQHPCIGIITQQINALGNVDFITTQENNAGGGLANDWGLDPKYKLAGSQEDAMIFYDSSKWKPHDFKTVPMTPDALHGGGAGPRNLTLSYFTNNKFGQDIVIATTHLCVDWDKSSGCKFNAVSPPPLPSPQHYIGINPNAMAHEYDAYKITEALKQYHPGSPVVITGDFNTKYPLDGGESGSDADVLPKFFEACSYSESYKQLPYDFLFHNDQLAVLSRSDIPQGANNPSDHPALDVTYTLAGGPTPPPPITCPLPSNVTAIRGNSGEPLRIQITPAEKDPAESYNVLNWVPEKDPVHITRDQGSITNFTDFSTANKKPQPPFVYNIQSVCAGGDTSEGYYKFTYSSDTPTPPVGKDIISYIGFGTQDTFEAPGYAQFSGSHYGDAKRTATTLPLLVTDKTTGNICTIKSLKDKTISGCPGLVIAAQTDGSFHLSFPPRF